MPRASTSARRDYASFHFRIHIGAAVKDVRPDSTEFRPDETTKQGRQTMTDDQRTRKPGASRRQFVEGGAAVLATLPALGATGAFAQALALPKSPVAISVIDVGGALALLQKPLENYRDAKKNLVSRMTFTKAPAPELPGKIKAMQEAGRVDIDLVIGGLDALSAGIEQKLWVERCCRPRMRRCPKPTKILLKAALDMHNLGGGQGMCVVYYPSGPLLEYMPAKVKTCRPRPRNC
jgi:putative spermidine/putrescine transport system substrate-binding protein